MLLFNNSNMTPGICFILYQFSFSLFYLDIVVNVHYQEYKKKTTCNLLFLIAKNACSAFHFEQKANHLLDFVG